jgi:hypothetical protein
MIAWFIGCTVQCSLGGDASEDTPVKRYLCSICSSSNVLICFYLLTRFSLLLMIWWPMWLRLHKNPSVSFYASVDPSRFCCICDTNELSRSFGNNWFFLYFCPLQTWFVCPLTQFTLYLLLLAHIEDRDIVLPHRGELGFHISWFIVLFTGQTTGDGSAHIAH